MLNYKLMFNFLIRFFKFLLILIVLLALYIFLIYKRPDLVDPFYSRVTTPKATSAIFGLSRAAQSLNPSIINEEFFQGDNVIINHAFGEGISNYGPNYYREIKSKIVKGDYSNIFILSITPWSLTIPIDSAEDTTSFSEVINNTFIGNLKSSSSNPNFEYLYKYWTERSNPLFRFFRKIFNYEKYSMILHQNGWLEVIVPINKEYFENRIKSVERAYLKKELKVSKIRMEYLSEIVDYLNYNGQVFIVRLPTSKEMKNIEGEMFQDFDEVVEVFSNTKQVKYINFIEESGNYLANDIHHLNRSTVGPITKRLCDSIRIYRID